jgi:hypothetical protein
MKRLAIVIGVQAHRGRADQVDDQPKHVQFTSRSLFSLKFAKCHEVPPGSCWIAGKR